MNTIKKIFILLIASLCLAVLPIPVHAQQTGGISLTITPPVIKTAVKPGKTITLAFTIENRGTTDLEVTPTLVDFSAQGSNGSVQLEQTSSVSFASLANAERTLNQPFQLLQGKKDQLVVQFAVPQNTQEKDYYQTLLIKTRPINTININTEGQTTPKAYAYIGANILLSVTNSGEDRGNLEIEQFALPKIVDMFSSLSVQPIVRNTGKTYTTANGTVTVKSPLRGVVKTYTLLPEDVLTHGTRTLHASAPDPNDVKDQIPIDMVYKPIAMLGPYTVQLTVHAPNQGEQTQTKTVWALPISPIIILTVFAGVLIGIRKKKNTQET